MSSDPQAETNYGAKNKKKDADVQSKERKTREERNDEIHINLPPMLNMGHFAPSEGSKDLRDSPPGC
ncbi:hypothetical protein Csa_019994 [Cucumis sativus]|nr:hypothetical protein Csa_019994 [Cucumis sativus]